MGAVAAAWFSYWSFAGGGGVKLAHKVMLVDVTNGQLYEASTAKKAILEPALAPDGSSRRLLRVSKEDSGKWVVAGRSMSLLDDLGVEAKAIDAESGEVLTPSASVVRYQVE